MKEPKDLKTDARKFVINALKEVSGRKPSKRIVATTVERIVRALHPIVTKTRRPPGETRP